MRSLVAVALALAVIVVLPATIAHEDDWEDHARDLNVDARSDGFDFYSDRTDGEQHDRICFELDGDNVRVRFEFLADAGDAQAEAQLSAELERIVEFRDTNGDGAFQATEDVRAEYDASDLSLANVTWGEVASGGVPGLQVTATYDFEDAPGSTFGLRVTAFGNLTTFQGLQQSPVEMKLDLVFGDFPYTRTDTLPAIELKVKSESPHGPNVTADDARFTSGDLTAVFGWLPAAEVDGVDRPVGVTTVRLPDEIEGGEVEAVLSVAFAYARGANIVHDPTFGFLHGLAETVVGAVLGNLTFYLAGALLAVVVFSGLAFARRRKVKKT